MGLRGNSETERNILGMKSETQGGMTNQFNYKRLDKDVF